MKTREARKQELEAIWRCGDFQQLSELYMEARVRQTGEYALPPVGTLFSQYVEMILDLEFQPARA